ncbi:hypothetical protein K7432_017214 [Basidiobolus ranarum]|uniref:Uncharacterized protein n=1 Tax=Basidiobolus ranarum TaxID=34480 RepID=A0ABR2WDM4_9FUNG
MLDYFFAGNVEIDRGKTGTVIYYLSIFLYMDLDIVTFFSDLEDDIKKQCRAMVKKIRKAKKELLLKYNMSELQNNNQVCTAIIKSGQKKGMKCSRIPKSGNQCCGYHRLKMVDFIPKLIKVDNTKKEYDASNKQREDDVNNKGHDGVNISDMYINSQESSGQSSSYKDCDSINNRVSPVQTTTDDQPTTSSQQLQEQNISGGSYLGQTINNQLSSESNTPECLRLLEGVGNESLPSYSEVQRLRCEITTEGDGSLVHLQNASVEIGAMISQEGGIIPSIKNVIIPYAWGAAWNVVKRGLS